MDPALLDEIPYVGDILLYLLLALKARLLAAFDITVVWNKPGNQVTVRAVITDATLQALPDILNPRQDGYHDTAPADSPLAAPCPGFHDHGRKAPYTRAFLP
jgi:hypothetical protein